MVERNAEVFVQSEAAHVRDVHMFVFYDPRKRLIGGEGARSCGESKHGVGLGFD